MGNKMSQNVLVHTKDPSNRLYVHFDPPSSRYLVQWQEKGACVFTEINALQFIQHLPDPEIWTIKKFDDDKIRHVAKDSDEGRRISKELEDLPGYTKTS